MRHGHCDGRFTSFIKVEEREKFPPNIFNFAAVIHSFTLSTRKEERVNMSHLTFFLLSCIDSDTPT